MPLGEAKSHLLPLEVGQCNDAYGAVVIATKLAEALQCALSLQTTVTG